MNIVLGFFAAFTVLNFVLILGLLRQSRRQNDVISALSRARTSNREILPRGTPIADFAATTVDGEQRSLADFAGAPGLFGIFVVHCPPCEAKIPEFKAYVRRATAQGARALAVVIGGADGVADYVSELGEVIPVVVEAPGGPLPTAFSVPGYPAFFALDPTGRVWSSGPTVRSLAQSPAPQAETSDVG